MKSISLEEQEAAPVDEETKAAIEQAQAEYRRGECVTLEEAQIVIGKQYQEWKEAQGNLPST